MPDSTPLDADAEYKSLIREVVEAATESAHALADVRPILAEYVAERKRTNDLEEKRQKQFGAVFADPSVKLVFASLTGAFGTLVAAASLYYASHWFGVQPQQIPSPPNIEHSPPTPPGGTP